MLMRALPALEVSLNHSIIQMTPRTISDSPFLTVLFLAILLLSLSGPASADERPEPSGFPEVMELTLTEAVFMAIRNNRALESAYLDRVLARFNLQRDLTKFHPDLEVTFRADTGISEESISYRRDAVPDSRVTTRSSGTSVITGISQKIPTGAEISFVWDNAARSRHASYRDESSRIEKPLDSAWGIDFRQPLLKGGGLEYNTASLVRARLGEENAVRALRDRVIDTVTGVITDYRTLLNSYQDLKVQKESLEKAREQMDVLRALINAGRRAPNEILQSEANVARHELTVEEAMSRVDDAQLNLLNRLNIGRDITIIPTESIEYRHVEPDFEECLEIVFQRHSGYQSALNQKEIARLTILEAENQRLWELSAEAGYRKGWHKRRSYPDYTRDEWNVGLSLNVPLPIYGEAKYARESPLLSARIGSRKAEMEIMNIEERLENEVRTRLRNVESSHKRVELARRTLELSKRSFEISELQFRMGLISNVDYIREQDKLRDDQLAEIQAIIAYENSLTYLDQLLATTLDTWEIEFTPRRADLEEEFLGRKTWMLGD